MAVTPEWEEVTGEILRTPGVAMVIGGVDTGKTRFCVELVNAAAELGLPGAVVDADVGQSEIGPPGTIGLGLAEKPVEALTDLKFKRLHFVGATSPAGHLLECVIGASRMVDAAREHGAALIVLDTTGLVDGPIGRKLKTYKTDLVRPDYLVGIQKRHEIEHLLAPFARAASIKIRKVSSPAVVRTKPPEFRAARRQMRFYEHFNDASSHIIRLDDVSCWNTWFCTGRPMKWQYMKFMEDTLGCRILHAEVTGRGVFAVAEKPCPQKDMRELEEQFRTRAIRIVTGESLTNLLVGLADENARVINVGLIQAIDFKQRFMSVLSPIKTVSPVRIVQFGSIRVTKEGKELGVRIPPES